MTRLSIKSRITLLVGLFLAGAMVFGAFTYRTIRTIMVSGPYYKAIVQGKDVIADVLPPPFYLIESYLNAFQMAGEREAGVIARLVERSDALRAEYGPGTPSGWRTSGTAP